MYVSLIVPSIMYRRISWMVVPNATTTTKTKARSICTRVCTGQSSSITESKSVAYMFSVLGVGAISRESWLAPSRRTTKLNNALDDEVHYHTLRDAWFSKGCILTT